jgi:ABC-type branched-subunit amino acid transport system substrate-binding protein/TolA-binding protein
MNLLTRFVVFSQIVVLGLALTTSVSAATVVEDSVIYKPAVERSFQEAMDLFRESRFAEARALFEQIVDLPGTNHRTSAAYLMAAKSRYHQGDYSASVLLLQSFLERFEHSEYVDDAQYTLALDEYQLEQYRESARAFLRVRQTSPDPTLAARALRMLGLVAADNLQRDELRELLSEANQTETKVLLTVRLAQKILQTGDARGTRELLNTVLSLPNTIPAVAEARALMKKIDQSGVVRIGVVLPLTEKSDQSAVHGVGEELLEGIRLATDEYNAESMPKVNLEVRDSEHDAGVAARQVSELSADSQILAILGPVFSNEVFAAAGFANKRGAPLLTPTATATGIASIGNYVFQANPDFVTRGRAMAQYASIAKGAHRFAVLAASDSADRATVEAFIQEVLDLGGQMVDVQYYKPGQTDLRDELTAMRQRGLELTEPFVISFGAKTRPVDLKKMASWGVPQHVLDSLVTLSSVATVESLFGDDGRHVADSMKIPTQRIRAKYDSLGLPVAAFDAIFLPISSSEEIGIVTSQLRYFNFQAQLLGNGSWYEPNELEQHRQYSNGVIFSTETYLDEINQHYQQFLKQFRATYSKDPTKNSIIGYDAVKILLDAIRQGATGREAIATVLRSAQTFQGIHSKTLLGARRVNSFLTILQYKNRSIKKIGEIDVSRKVITGTDEHQ